MGAEIPAGFYGLAGMRAPAEGSAARAACLMGAVMRANRVFYAANSVRGCGTRRRGRLSLAAWPDSWIEGDILFSLPLFTLILQFCTR